MLARLPIFLWSIGVCVKFRTPRNLNAMSFIFCTANYCQYTCRVLPSKWKLLLQNKWLHVNMILEWFSKLGINEEIGVCLLRGGGWSWEGREDQDSVVGFFFQISVKLQYIIIHPQLKGQFFVCYTVFRTQVVSQIFMLSSCFEFQLFFLLQKPNGEACPLDEKWLRLYFIQSCWIGKIFWETKCRIGGQQAILKHSIATFVGC